MDEVHVEEIQSISIVQGGLQQCCWQDDITTVPFHSRGVTGEACLTSLVMQDVTKNIL